MNPKESRYLRIFRLQSPVTVVDLDRRTVIWLQGRARRCPGCIVPESRSETGGELIDFIDFIDLSIDGLDLENLHDNLLWRGARNQGLRLLTERYRDILLELLRKGDVSAGLEFVSGESGELYCTGVPRSIDLQERFEAKLPEKGILLRA